MHPLLVRLTFYPTLGWNLLLSRVFRLRRWHDRIDDHVILGALPFPHQVAALRKAGVRGVVNTCAEYPGPLGAYARYGIAQLHIPTLDFHPPRIEDVEAALAFLHGHADRGETVYVHCKAGRGRSATVVLCWLMDTRGLDPLEAQGFLAARRPHVNRGLHEREVVKEMHRRLLERTARRGPTGAFRDQA